LNSWGQKIFKGVSGVEGKLMENLLRVEAWVGVGKSIFWVLDQVWNFWVRKVRIIWRIVGFGIMRGVRRSASNSVVEWGRL
jgi:hypothetical protein